MRVIGAAVHLILPALPNLKMHSLTEAKATASIQIPSANQRRPASNALIVVAGVAVVLSISSFVYFYVDGSINFYGDGIAHLNIARKVVDSPDDSLWQRYMQIGSPWLPLQTLLIAPLVTNDWMWRTGAAGSIVSMVSFVITALALYLHAGLLYSGDERYGTILPALSAGIFIFNPTALYLQSTPMSEPVLMASLAVGAYLLQQWLTVPSANRLVAAAAAMTIATLARYEAWPIAALSVLIVLVASPGGVRPKLKNALLFGMVVAAGPCYWLWHNWAIYGDALWFLTGPYSARGIYLQNQAALGWAKVFVGNAPAAVLLMTSMVAVCVGPILMIPAVMGFFRLVKRHWGRLIEVAPAILLIVPLLFHTYSLFRGEIQVFPLSAFGLLNVRYGLPHLLPVALFAPAAVPLLDRLGKEWAVGAFCLLVATQYGYLLSEGPSQLAIYQEGFRNGVNSRPARERARFSSLLRENPPGEMVLMHSGPLGPVVSQGGLRFSGIIHEGTSRWHQIDAGLPEDVKTIIFQEGDPLDQRVRANPVLTRDLAENFREQGRVGEIKLLTRVERDVQAPSN
jgi:hypothetical protein